MPSLGHLGPLEGAKPRFRCQTWVVITNPTVSSPYLSDLKRHQVPFVFVGRPIEEAPYVDNDNVEVSRIGVRHLIECGHRRIAFLSGPDRFTFCQDRLLGYRITLEEAGLPYDAGLVWQSEEVEEAAYQVVCEAIKHHEFTALFAVSGIQAVGAIRAFRAHGLSVPEDVAVVCVNDTELTRYFVPPLTTVDLHEDWLGYWAVKRLVQLIEGDQSDHTLLIPGKLVVRASSGQCPRKVAINAKERKVIGETEVLLDGDTPEVQELQMLQASEEVDHASA